MNDYGPKVRRHLREAGWELLRQAKGSHEMWHDPATGKRQPVPHKIKKKHTANGILKDAGLPKAF